MRVTVYDIGILASFNCPKCRTSISPGTNNFCTQCGVDLQWDAAATEFHNQRLDGGEPRRFNRGRDRIKNDFIFISDAELAEQGIPDKFRMGYWLEYNGERRLIAGINKDGIFLTTT